jgi:tetratricopeptide (TPR) repeat protein
MNRGCELKWIWIGLLFIRGLWAQSPPPPGVGGDYRPVADVETVSVSTLIEEAVTKDSGMAGLNIFTYPSIMDCGQELKGLSAPEGARIVVPLEITGDKLRMTLRMFGGQGDADLYLSYAEVPGLHSYQYRPYVNGNMEEINLESPTNGRWFLMVHAYRAFSDVSISLSCVASETETVAADFVMDRDIELALYYELSGVENTNRVRSVALQNQMLNFSGRQAFTAGRYNEALELWTQWMAQDPQNPRPVSLVGDLYLRADDLDTAISYYRKSLEIQPGQIGLMTRLARILDQEANQPEESKKLLNHFSRLFPNSSGVALGQAEWLIRRNRYEEAIEVISRVIKEDPENLNAMSLMMPLLSSQEARYQNMRNMVRIGQMPGREISLGFAIRDNDLLTRPESWVLMDFIYRMAGEARSEEQRRLFEELLPRADITIEDFRIGRMSTNWVSSREGLWGEEGSLILSADPSQTEAFLRLKRSDAMHNGFVEARVDDSRGFFWIYARRGIGNMIRYGFAENGQLYLQVWINDHLVSNQTRVWSRLPGDALLRLELIGDGAMGYINGEPAFSSPAPIPEEMGLGWWGIAPWSAQYGTASVTVSKVAGGPLPVRLGLIPATVLKGIKSQSDQMSPIAGKLNRIGLELSGLAPEWYSQDERGQLNRLTAMSDREIRLLARYYRMRLLPMLKVRSYRALDLDMLSRMALQDRVDGFTLLVDRMPEPDWLSEAEDLVTRTGITLHFILLDPQTRKASFREICGTVGTFPGPRTVKMLDFQTENSIGEKMFSDADPDTIYYFDGAPLTP